MHAKKNNKLNKKIKKWLRKQSPSEKDQKNIKKMRKRDLIINFWKNMRKIKNRKIRRNIAKKMMKLIIQWETDLNRSWNKEMIYLSDRLFWILGKFIINIVISGKFL